MNKILLNSVQAAYQNNSLIPGMNSDINWDIEEPSESLEQIYWFFKVVLKHSPPIFDDHKSEIFILYLMYYNRGLTQTEVIPSKDEIVTIIDKIEKII